MNTCVDFFSPFQGEKGDTGANVSVQLKSNLCEKTKDAALSVFALLQGKDGSKGEPGPPGLPGRQVLVTAEVKTITCISHLLNEQ